VDNRTVVIFTRQLATLLLGGVQIVKALEVLSDQPENPRFGQVVEVCSKNVATGSKLSSSLAMFPTVFPSVFIHMVSIGEETGQLVTILARLSNWLENDRAQRQRVQSALNYPMFVFGLSGFLCLMLFYKVMPGFIGIFEDMKVPLPVVTQVVMGITKAIQTPWFWIVSVVAILLLRQSLKKLNSTLPGRARAYRILLKIPVLGPLLSCSSQSRYCATVEIMLNSGMRYLQVFELAAKSSGNPVIEQDATQLLKSIKEGDLVSQYMTSHSEIYGVTTCALLRVGEESSRISEMMKHASYYYELEISNRLDTLGAALEPLMLAGVGIMVAIIVISIFLPMYSYLMKMGM
jgi:type II secretory pathway component PulF